MAQLDDMGTAYNCITEYFVHPGVPITSRDGVSMTYSRVSTLIGDTVLVQGDIPFTEDERVKLVAMLKRAPDGAPIVLPHGIKVGSPLEGRA